MKPSDSRLALVILAVADLPRAVAFYQSVFGWEQLVSVPAYVEFRLPAQLRLGLYVRSGFALNVGQTPLAIEPGEIAGSELYFYPDDLRAAIARLEAAGSRCLSPLKPRDWGDEAAYFTDPDRNVLVVARPLH